jgi:DNA-binding transcriptional regulator GbsR (MarR family)
MKMTKNWNLMATHGVVLFYIAANPDSTMRQMSESLNLTERRIAQVVRDLSDANLLEVTRVGRRNSYSVNPAANFRHPTLSHITLGKFVKVLTMAPLTLLAAMQFYMSHGLGLVVTL